MPGEEIDLASVIKILLRKWKLIVGVALLAALVAGLVNYFLFPPEFESSSFLLVVNGPQFKMETQIATPNMAAESLVESARLLFQSSELAGRVRAELADVFKQEQRTLPLPKSLIDCIRLEFGSKANEDKTIRLFCVYDTPRICLAIADAWLKVGIKEIDALWNAPINELYDYLLRERNILAEELSGLEDHKRKIDEEIIESELESRVLGLSSKLTGFEIEQGTVEKDIEGRRERVRTFEAALTSMKSNITLGISNMDIQARDIGIGLQASRSETGVLYRALAEVCDGFDVNQALSFVNDKLADLEQKENPGNDEISKTLEILKTVLEFHSATGKKGTITYDKGVLKHVYVLEKASLNELNGQYAGLTKTMETVRSNLAASRKLLAAKSKEIAKLKRMLELKEETFKIVSKKLEETKLLRASQLTPLKIIQKPYLPDAPVRPARMRNVLLTFILGVLLAGGVVVAGYSMDSSAENM